MRSSLWDIPVWICCFPSCQGKQWILRLPRMPSDPAQKKWPLVWAGWGLQVPCTNARGCAAGAHRQIKDVGHSQGNKRGKPKESEKQREGWGDKDQSQIWYFTQIRDGAEVQFKVHKTKIQRELLEGFVALRLCSQWYSHPPGDRGCLSIMQHHRTELTFSSRPRLHPNMHFEHF